MPAPPLTHLRVLDLTDLRGALAGRLLGDLGADVIKVEPPGGDPGRWQPPFAGNVRAPDRSLPFLYRNANKRGAVIDLHDASGRQRFAELCERADILLENFGTRRTPSAWIGARRGAGSTSTSDPRRDRRLWPVRSARRVARGTVARLRRVGCAARLGVS